MKRRLLLATLLTTTAGARFARAADGFPYGDSLVFKAYRNGSEIGHHSLRFSEQGGLRHVSTSIDLAVRMLGLTFYKFTYRCQESWSGDLLQSLDAETEDDGKKYVVRASRAGDSLSVEHSGPDTVAKASTGDQQGSQQGGVVRETIPGTTLPSTHWNIAQVRQSGVLNTEYGKIMNFQVVDAGRQTIKTSTGTLAATRYDYTGEINMSQWFDDRSRWVKSTFVAPDSSTIEYVLQE